MVTFLKWNALHRGRFVEDQMSSLKSIFLFTVERSRCIQIQCNLRLSKNSCYLCICSEMSKFSLSQGRGMGLFKCNILFLRRSFIQYLNAMRRSRALPSAALTQSHCTLMVFSFLHHAITFSFYSISFYATKNVLSDDTFNIKRFVRRMLIWL